MEKSNQIRLIASIVFCFTSIMVLPNEKAVEKSMWEPNKPMMLLKEKSGGRLSPGLFYSSKLKKFVYFNGLHKSKTPHYDVEYFDLATNKWSNAYPAGSPYKVATGTTDAKVHSVTRSGIFNLE